jgi:hypothetical protein
VGKPGFYFYTGDWLKKTRLLTLGARGAWIDLLVLMDEQKPRGQVTLSLAQYAGYWNVSTEVAAGVLLELELTRTANISPSLSDASVTLQASRVTPRDFHVTVASRKMLRENNSKELHRLRQRRYRVTHQGDARVTPPLLNPSPSLLSQSEEDKNLLLHRDVSARPSRSAITSWPDDALWLKGFLETQTSVRPPNGALIDYPWWSAVSETCGGLTLPWLSTEFNRIAAWLMENPSRNPGTPRGWKRFIRHWLEKAHERERRQPTYGAEKHQGRGNYPPGRR